MKKDLTDNQEKFCQNYHLTGNATQSYVDAYCQENRRTAEVQASRLLRKPKVRDRLGAMKKRAAKKHEMTVDKLIKENVAIAFSKLSNVIRITEEGDIELLPDGDIDELEGGSYSKSESSSSSDKGETLSKTKSISFKRPDRVKALQEIAKLIGAYDKDGKDNTKDRELNADSILHSLEGFTDSGED